MPKAASHPNVAPEQPKERKPRAKQRATTQEEVADALTKDVIARICQVVDPKNPKELQVFLHKFAQWTSTLKKGRRQPIKKTHNVL